MRLRLKFWKPKEKSVPEIIQETTFNQSMTHLPAKYPKPAKSFLTVLQPGGGSTILQVKEISTEEIRLPDGSTLYTGVPPDLTYHKLTIKTMWLIFRLRKHWTTIRMHYTMFGWPFTFDPKTFSIFSNIKKRRLLIARGAGIPVEVGDRNIVVLIDPETQSTKDPRPIWQPEEITKDEKKKLFKDSTPETFYDLESWIKSNIDELDKMETIQLPVATIHDVSEMEMLRSETFQLIENETIEKTLQSMEALGGDKGDWWKWLLAPVSVLVSILLFLYFANEGVFMQ